ncbi:MAG TPA: DUF3619 family protein [Aromatoleum sp.]|uniref:DUF3619 family protein n=1 Tax=Aromatoleum sp. TaxID=2307007 RepID=UPI002B475626|nr:DUF3619 family protein [Aromatoleum sp.]HJV27222.1 DUF3619 family protein [Aromatoleum sp.]
MKTQDFNEERLARRMAAHLSAGARDVDDHISERLRLAREQALAAYRPRPGLLARLAMPALVRGLIPPVARPAAVAVLLLAVIFAGDYYVTWSRVASLQDVDMALLIDDLPIDAYLDKDFKAWLQDDSRS